MVVRQDRAVILLVLVAASVASAKWRDHPSDDHGADSDPSESASPPSPVAAAPPPFSDRRREFVGRSKARRPADPARFPRIGRLPLTTALRATNAGTGALLLLSAPLQYHLTGLGSLAAARASCVWEPVPPPGNAMKFELLRGGRHSPVVSMHAELQRCEVSATADAEGYEDIPSIWSFLRLGPVSTRGGGQWAEVSELRMLEGHTYPVTSLVKESYRR